MPTDLQTIADPRFILMAWAGGLALVGGGVGRLRIVGPGFTWLISGTAAVVGLAGALSSGAIWAKVALGAMLIGLALARTPRRSSGILLLGGVAFIVEAALLGGWAPAVSAAVALGGVTGEMMLGHWYLVDPRLPRWALRGLAVAGVVGLIGDGLLLSTVGQMPAGGATVAFWVLVITSVVLMVAVIAAIRYPAYSGVMAATGLSYLAVLTSLGSVFLGRALLAGLGPFAS